MKWDVELYPPYNQLDPAVVEKAKAYLSSMGVARPDGASAMTPYRLTHYLQYLKEGAEEFHPTAFKNENPIVSNMVVIPGIHFWSACSHHCLPFFGTIDVGYIPNKLIIGLSKIPLLVRSLAQGYWMQEHLIDSIANHLDDLLAPQGIGVRVQAQHTCQLLDLGQPPIPVMKTTVLRGIMLHGPAARDEFYSLIGG